MGDGSSSRSDSKGKGRATPNNGMLALDLEHAEGGVGVSNGGNSAFQQMQLVEQQVRPTPRPQCVHSDQTVLACAG
jgi:syntaxin 5